MDMDKSSLSIENLHFEDSSLWHVEPNIPIFCPHSRYDKEGNLLYEVTENDLYDVLENTTRLFELGVPIRQTDGHLKQGKDIPQKEQPALIGYAIKPRMGEHKGMPCILVDLYTKKKHQDLLENRPYRSVEYRASTKEIRGVARLINDPALDLGVTTVYEAPTKSFQFSLEHYMDSVTGDVEGKTNGTPPTPEVEAPTFTPEEEALGEKMYAYLCAKGYMPKGQEKYEDGPGTPGGNNTFVPGDKDKKKKPPVDEGDETVVEDKPNPEDTSEEDTENMASNELLEQYAARIEKLEGDYKAERELRITAQQNADKADCTRLIDNLIKNEHYLFDRDTEVEILQKIEPAKRPARLKYLRQTGKQKPGANRSDDILVAEGNFEGGTENYQKENEQTLADSNEIARLASAKGIGFDEAKAEYYNKAKRGS